MDDPYAKVKTKKIAEHQNDSLAIAVGEAEAIIPLQRLQARTTINPNADTSGDPLAACVSKLRKHLQGKSPSKPLEAIFLSDPARPGWALRVHHDRLWAWARVLEQKEAGNITEANQNVDYDTPPSGPFFSWEPRASVSPVRHIAGQITHHTPTNTTPQAHTSAPLTPGTSSFEEMSQVGRTTFSAATGSVASMTSPNTLASQDRIEPTKQHATAQTPLVVNQGSSNSISVHSNDSTDSVECLNQPNKSIDHPNRWSPTRQIPNIHPAVPQRPLGHTTSRRAAISCSAPSPPRKHHMKTKNLRPLTEEGRRFTLEEFFLHCHMEPDLSLVQSFLDIHQVAHWSFFRGKSVDFLFQLGWPLGPANHLFHGVNELEKTLVQPKGPNDSDSD
ncbi:hypothetical protein H4Q26_001340 [Puccinia striiformis f. sp. tritici PST-130]|nr:hypothetical protein H4Q26_001340 [Puccinia striiformis f. sp. tritici PST-130]